VRTKLEKEAIAAKEIDHINIPALYDFGIEDDQLIYVTEYFEGSSAEEWVNEHGPMPTGAVLRIALQVMGAMGAAAFHKISHHAINPANLILVPGQTPEGDWPLEKVRRLLAQMLSVKPEARPQDPLAVYRQIQECVAQVERRESMARKFGVPFLSGPKVAALPSRRRIPTKFVALAAIVIALATLASISLASYLRHQRVRQAEEPIGVPIGVTDPNASAAPVIASAPTIAPAPPPQQTTAPTTTEEENQPPGKTEPAPAVAANPPPPAPVQQPETAAPPADNPPAEAPKVAANETKPVVEEKPATTLPKESAR